MNESYATVSEAGCAKSFASALVQDLISLALQVESQSELVAGLIYSLPLIYIQYTG